MSGHCSINLRWNESTQPDHFQGTWNLQKDEVACVAGSGFLGSIQKFRGHARQKPN